MNFMIDDSKPIFVQIAERIEDDILTEVLPEESQVPSTNQFAAYYQVNSATAAKGVNMLVDEEILYKKRGIGMFVSTGARKIVLQKRKTQFYEQYVRAMMKEAEKLEISLSELVHMIEKGNKIYGLLRRNGAGKTTLMHLLTAQLFASTGSIEVFGGHPYENNDVIRQICF